MRAAFNDVSKSPWVDVFSEPNFRGRIQRIRGSVTNGALVIRHPQLLPFRSIIVGPVAVAELERSGNRKPIKLSPRTILADVLNLTGRNGIRSLAVLSNCV